MRYLLLIVSFIVALVIKLLSTSNFSFLSQKPALAIDNTLENISNSWKISQTYIPPDRGAPESTSTGGTRGGECLLLNQKLTLLLPENGGGLTISEYPTLYVYIPSYEKAKEAIFFLTDADDQEIYEGIFQLPKRSGIIQLKIPEKKLAALEVGQNYTWGVQISCISKIGDQSGDPIVEGIIKRIKPEESLSNKLAGVTPLTLSTVYASEGIWYDALESIVQLRSLNPENSQLIKDWQKLFNSAKSERRESFIDAPLLECCELED